MTALVTGAGSDIGKAIAAELARKGMRVSTHSRSASGVDFNGDLSSPDVVERLAADVGPVSVLICAAGGNLEGLGERDNALGFSLAEIEGLMKNNLYATILTCQRFAAGMIERKDGAIVTIGSASACFGKPEGVAYAVSKAALHEYSRCLAAQVRDSGVSVNCLALGNTLTAGFRRRHPDYAAPVPDDDSRRLRCRTPEEIAKFVSFLVTDGRGICAQVIRIDGGHHTFPC